MKLTEQLKVLIEEYGEEEVISALMTVAKKAKLTVTYEDLDAIYFGYTTEKQA